eukprot:g34798.t1
MQHTLLIETIATEIEVEIDLARTSFRDAVGKDLLHASPPQPKVTHEDHLRMEVMEQRAARNRKKMQRQKQAGKSDFKAENEICPLTDDEKIACSWRRLCDAALQEDKDSIYELSKMIPKPALCAGQSMIGPMQTNLSTPPEALASDQGCIFAVCSTEDFVAEEHVQWSDDFVRLASCANL